MSQQDTPPTPTTPTADNAKHALVCSKCNLPLGDQLVRALDGAFHPECFTCWDCNTPVASRYLPHPTEIGQPLCERDYFRRLGLVCAQCNEALRGTYIIALDRKYHTNHFTCNDCSTVFGPDDSYYEHDSKVYCHFHYSTQFAVSCAGCDMSILKQYVEIERNDLVDHWHPECYMIQKFWSVKIAHPTLKESDPIIPREYKPQSPLELLKTQKEMEEKVISIWSVLSAFEESSAVCISEMLLHVSNGAYIESICLSERFLVHVEALFAGIDKIQSIYQEYKQPEFKYTREAKMLCKKIINFFSLLSRTGDMEMKKLGITQELLSLVTGLAHYLKILIRLALTCALRLEITVGKPVVVSRLLAKLMEIPGKERHSRDCQRLIKAKNTDFCHSCRNTIEDQCMRCGDYRWHMACFKCRQCARQLNHDDAVFNSASCTIHCVQCVGVTKREATPFEYITKLTQYSFLLRVALSRLCNLLQITDTQLSSVDYSSKIKPNTSNSNNLIKDAVQLSPSAEKQLTIMTDDKFYPTEITDAKNTVSSSTTHLDRKVSRSFKSANKRSTILGNADLAASLKTQPQSSASLNSTAMRSMPPARMDSLQRTRAGPGADQHKDLPQLPSSRSNNATRHKPTRSVGLDDLPQLAAAAVASKKHMMTNLPHNIHITTGPSGKPRIYFSELSALQYMIIRYVAVVQIEQYVKSSFSSSELLNLIEFKKSSIWGKFFIPFKNKKNHGPKAKEEGTFGVPLDILTERTGVESNLGSGHSPLKLASFIDDAITAMRQMDMTVEGVFRKNGNIRRLKELADALDRNANDVDLTQENAIQVAALLKKFLRDLPDPLLTHRLHPLFMCAERIEDPVQRRRALHLACCMLPRCNRATMEVLFVFFRWVASFSHVTGDVGSRMDIPNLARVIAPNILTANSKDPLKDDSFASIRVVEVLLESHEEFCLVPDDLEVFLQDPNLSDVDISPKEFLKRVEQTVKHKNPSSSNLNTANGAGASSKSSMHSANPAPSNTEGIKLFDGTVTDGRQHPPTSIYAQQQYLPYTNNHPNSDFVPQQLNMRYHQPGSPIPAPPRRMDSHESFASMNSYYPNNHIDHHLPSPQHRFVPQHNNHQQQHYHHHQQSPLNTAPTSTSSPAAAATANAISTPL
ncbi:Rho-type GTPase activating protein Rga1 [Mucor circinelloides]